MKVLTLTQPWASLVACGAKKIETRNWSTRYRGKLAIHAAKTIPEEALELCYQSPFTEALIAAGFKKQVPMWVDGFTRKTMIDEVNPGLLPFGKIVAVCKLVSCQEIPTAGKFLEFYHLEGRWPIYQERAFGDFTAGRYAWMLEDVVPLALPIPAKGSLGLWEYPNL